MQSAKTDGARCSFCHKGEDAVERLVRSQSDVKARICDECLIVCQTILSDDVPPPRPPAQPDLAGHCRLCDPRISDLLNTLELWVIAESQHCRSRESLSRARRLAFSIMGLGCR